MQDFNVTVQGNNKIFPDAQFVDGVAEYSFNFAPWSEKYGTVTTVTWTVISGDVAVSNTALTSSVATGRLTFGNAGANLVQIKATNGGETVVVYLDVPAKDPQEGTDDYGF